MSLGFPRSVLGVLGGNIGNIHDKSEKPVSGKSKVSFRKGPCSDKIVAIVHERIERKRIFYADGRKRQKLLKAKPYTPNPERLEIGRLGDQGVVYCYPYSNPNNVFVSVNGETTMISLEHRRDLRILANRVDGLAHFIERGYRSEKRQRPWAKKVLKAYNAGLEQALASKKCQNATLHNNYTARARPTHEAVIEAEYRKSRGLNDR